MGKCTRCGLHRHRRQEVGGMGAVPADILFIGEAPGSAEDLRGLPVVGMEARLIHDAVTMATRLAEIGQEPTWHYANTVRCRPCNGRSEPNREVTAAEAWACWPQLKEVWSRVHPKQVIFLGKQVERFCKEAMKGGIYLYHPTYILMSGGEKSSQWREFVRKLSEIILEVKKCPRKLKRKSSSSAERNLRVSSMLQKQKQRTIRRRTV